MSNLPVARSPLVDWREERQAQLAECEEQIERGTGMARAALRRIRDERLHVYAGHGTLAGYLKARWGISLSRAYQEIEAAEIEQLAAPARESVSTIVETEPSTHALRAMAPLKRDPAALNRVAEKVYAHGLTARETAELVRVEQLGERNGHRVITADAVRAQRRAAAADALRALETLWKRIGPVSPHDVIEWSVERWKLKKVCGPLAAWLAEAATEIEEES